MRIQPEISGASVVLVGHFSPQIFTPAWFALHDLLPDSAADTAEVQIVHPGVTAFTFDWLRLEVTAERFLIETLQAPHVRVRDLVVRVFRERLNHAPVKALGINRHVHFQVPSLAARDRIGRRLAPVEPWGAWSRDLGLDGEHGGMTSLTMSQMILSERPTGDQINVTVEPSNRIGQRRSGVYVRVNDHYVHDDTDPGDCKRAMELLEANFEKSLKRSDEIIDHVMSLAEGREG